MRGGVVDEAVIFLVGMPGDHKVHFRVKSIDDIQMVPISRCNCSSTVGNRLRESARPPLRYLVLELRNHGIDGIRLIMKFQTGHARGRHNSRRALQRHADEGDLDAQKAL